MQTWSLQKAQDSFVKVVDSAVQDGPQIITQQGDEVAVVLSIDEYRRLTASRKKLSDFFRESPLAEVELDLSRDQSPLRPDADL